MSPRMLELREGTEWKTGRLQKSRHAIFGGRNTNRLMIKIGAMDKRRWSRNHCNH